jgi:rfaE bifunctional protein nucleotidyltransferase chain/domain
MIVFTNGCFDVLHRGHIDYLEKSKKLGTKLVIGLNSDASVRRLKIGRPINTQEDRKSVLLSLRCVDEVIIFDDDTPFNLIQRLKPDILTKGGDYKVSEVVGSDIVPQTVIIPFLSGYSTTNILKKMSEIYIT